MPRDTDGTNWMTVRYTIDVDVMAEDADDALFHAQFFLKDAIEDCRYTEEVISQ
jgi:hypothetical protein